MAEREKHGKMTPHQFQSVQDQLEIKFRLMDGSDIGPESFPASLKESALAQWPKDKENGLRTVKDVKLISAGRTTQQKNYRPLFCFITHLFSSG